MKNYFSSIRKKANFITGNNHEISDMNISKMSALIKEELFAFFRERKSENAGIHSLFIFLSYTIKNCPEGSLIPLHGIDFPSEKEKIYEARKNIHAGRGIFAFRVVALFFFFLFCFRSASRLSPRR